MKSGVLLLLGLVALIWVVELVNAFATTDHALNAYGILPRHTDGLRGIPLAPLLHGGSDHAMSNTLPLLVLGGLVALRGGGVFAGVTLFVVVVGGAGVWIAGRDAIHVGASGLVFGYFGYLVARGWYERSILSIIVAIVVAILYGFSIILGVLPTDGFISWEAHLFGLIAGVLAARLSKPKRDSRDG